MSMQAPIGVFDSGLGGLTVLRAMLARLPGEDFLYYADTQHLPYGDKPESFLRQRGQHIAALLVAQGCKALVIACNTATAAAAEAIRASFPLPVVALEPAIKPAVAQSRSGVVGVLATSGTLASARFQRLVDEHASGHRVIAQACPGLAEAIEHDGPESGAVADLLDRYLPPLAEADQVVLGCTHYPWVQAAIARRLPGVALIDTGEAVARQLERQLSASGRQGGGSGQVRLLTSGQPQQVRATVARLWGAPLVIRYAD